MNYSDHKLKQQKPPEERLGVPFTFSGLAERFLGWVFFVALFQWVGLQNDSEYIKDHFVMFAFLHCMVISHLVCHLILLHAMNWKFSYLDNYTFCIVSLLMLVQGLAFEISG